jgi:hypothetical protein
MTKNILLKNYLLSNIILSLQYQSIIAQTSKCFILKS